MRSTVRLAVVGVIVGVALAACGGDDHGGGQGTNPSTSTSTGFEPFAQQQVKTATCDNTIPATVTGVTFVFAADQDTADPRDLSQVTPGCTQ